MIEAAGITVVTEKECEYQLKVSGDQQANKLLRDLTESGVTVVTFELERTVSSRDIRRKSR